MARGVSGRQLKDRAAELVFRQALSRSHLSQPEREYLFHPTRRWRFDYAWPDALVALEVEGGAFARERGRHTRGVGFVKDMEKYNTAVLMGWRILRVTPEQLCTTETVAMVAAAVTPVDAQADAQDEARGPDGGSDDSGGDCDHGDA